MNKLVTLLFALFLAACSVTDSESDDYSKWEFSGYVLDASNGKGLEGATISCLGFGLDFGFGEVQAALCYYIFYIALYQLCKVGFVLLDERLYLLLIVATSGVVSNRIALLERACMPLLGYKHRCIKSNFKILFGIHR